MYLEALRAFWKVFSSSSPLLCGPTSLISYFFVSAQGSGALLMGKEQEHFGALWDSRFTVNWDFLELPQQKSQAQVLRRFL